MDRPDKDLIRRRFRRGLESYRDAAEIQKRMAEKLLRMLLDCTGGRRSFGHILEIGAGTGILTDETDRLFSWDRRWVNDLVPECSRYHERRRRTEFIPGDAEAQDWNEHCFNLILSNAAFQWFADLPDFLKKLCRGLVSGGLLAFTTFGPENMKELQALAIPSLPYRSLPELTGILNEAGFSVLRAEEEQSSLPFADPLDILHHFRQTGVTASSGPTPAWTRSRLQEFCDEYRRRFARPDGTVALTWHPIYIIAKGDSK